MKLISLSKKIEESYNPSIDDGTKLRNVNAAVDYVEIIDQRITDMILMCKLGFKRINKKEYYIENANQKITIAFIEGGIKINREYFPYPPKLFYFKNATLHDLARVTQDNPLTYN